MKPTVGMKPRDRNRGSGRTHCLCKNCSMLSIENRADSRWDGARVLEGTYSNPCQNHHIVPPKIDRNLPLFFPFFPLPLSLFPLIFLPSSFFPLSEVTLFEPSTGRLGSPLLLHFFLILTQARIQMHSQSCNWICVCFSLFSLYFQGFWAVSLLFFFVFFLFEKEENKRESCLRRYEAL